MLTCGVACILCQIRATIKLPVCNLGCANYCKFIATHLLFDTDFYIFQLTIPKFKLEESLELHEIFTKMGIKDVFTAEKADLTGISKSASDLHVDQVRHKAVLEVRIHFLVLSYFLGEPLSRIILLIKRTKLCFIENRSKCQVLHGLCLFFS